MSAESSSKKVKEDSCNPNEAISEQVVENIADSVNPPQNVMDSSPIENVVESNTTKNVVGSINHSNSDENLMDSHLIENFYCDLQLQTYEELNSLQFEPCNDLPTIFSRAYQEEMGKGDYNLNYYHLKY